MTCCTRRESRLCPVFPLVGKVKPHEKKSPQTRKWPSDTPYPEGIFHDSSTLSSRTSKFQDRSNEVGEQSRQETPPARYYQSGFPLLFGPQQQKKRHGKGRQLRRSAGLDFMVAQLRRKSVESSPQICPDPIRPTEATRSPGCLVCWRHSQCAPQGSGRFKGTPYHATQVAPQVSIFRPGG